MNEWNAMTYDGKDTILRVVQHEAARMFALADEPATWDVQTPCEKWKVKDVIGHLVDTTESYFAAFDAVKAGEDLGDAYGLVGMHERAGEYAQKFHHLSQAELMARVRSDLDKMMGILEPMTADEWTGFIVPHFYMGPLPAFFYAAGQLMDYGVHTWDIEEGLGLAHALSGEAADLLVPFMFVVWQYTIKPDADMSPFTVGIKILSGHNAGGYRVSISDQGMSYEAGDVDDLPAVIEFDASSFVLTAFGRMNAGTVRGDQALADRFLSLFYRI